jgi:hypothetical protein
VCRDIEIKKLNDPHRLFQRDPTPTTPSIREVVKGVPASFAPELFVFQTIDFMAVTPGAENMAFFPPEFPEEQFRPAFCSPHDFKGFYFFITGSSRPMLTFTIKTFIPVSFGRAILTFLEFKKDEKSFLPDTS